MVKIYENPNDTEHWEAGIFYEFNSNKYSENNFEKMMDVVKFNLEQDKFIEIYKIED